MNTMAERNVLGAVPTEVSATPELQSPYTLWLASLDVPQKTLRTYAVAIHDWECWAQRRGITAPTEQDVRTYRDELAARINERTGRTCSVATVQLYVGTVKRCFGWLEKVGLYRNVAADVRTPTPGRAHKKDYLTAPQIRAVLDAVSGGTEKELRDYAIIRLMATTGLRTVEVARANVEDLRPLAGITVLYVQGKGCEDRSEFVEIPEGLEDAIRRYLTARGDVHETEPLFTGVGNRARTRMRSESISRIVKNVLRLVGIDDSRHTAHSLRHSAATHNLLQGGTLQETQALMRHASVNTTLIYAHNLESAQNRSASRVEAAIFG